MRLARFERRVHVDEPACADWQEPGMRPHVSTCSCSAAPGAESAWQEPGMRPHVSSTGPRLRGQQGFAMAALLVALAVMSLLLSMALPAWRHAAQREREAELIFRGEQYARAIMLYQRRTPGAWPPDVETLVEGRFLRRAYRDPMTAGGEFRLVLQSELAGASGADAEGGAPGGASGEADDGPLRRRRGEAARAESGFRPGVRPFGNRNEETSGVDGNVAGVVSRSEETSIALYKGRSKYSEWIFTVGGAAGGPAGAPGSGVAGAADSAGGRRGAGSGSGPGGFGRRQRTARQPAAGAEGARAGVPRRGRGVPVSRPAAGRR